MENIQGNKTQTYGFRIGKLVRETLMNRDMPIKQAQEIADEIEKQINSGGCTWVETDIKQFEKTFEAKK